MSTDSWIEGFPTEAGDYWFYLHNPDRTDRAGRLMLGRASMSGNNVLMFVAEGCFLNEQRWEHPHKIFHKKAILPEGPEISYGDPVSILAECDEWKLRAARTAWGDGDHQKALWKVCRYAVSWDKRACGECDRCWALKKEMGGE